MAVRLSLLHTFVVVARSGRMRHAADQMAVTPGAISQRIRELEDAVGQRLFTRTQAGVELNAAGKALFASLDDPFRMIEDVDRKLDGAPSRRITITTMSSFAANWLVPRLVGFSRRHPDIDVAMETESRIVDLRREPVDLAIRHGLGDYPGLEATWLMAPELIVVASPELLRSGRPIATPADCLAFPLLHDIGRADWRLWFAAQGVDLTQDLKGPSFSDDHLMVRAAVSGQGLALVRNVYADDDLRANRLVQAIAVRWPTQFAYYAVGTAEALQRPAVRHFRDWLAMEASENPAR
ncbi:LysR family transcriptional regulator [Mesorhizobium sp. M9A.F.Ca.ET.002.03.1.2]|uniref:LysR substrate-binding domain-containing protein n=1 Tax=Mesorhizobium sp. M9A.F.Ca.ET.002.03.1.2 TaxID=2493668 RepID=UPI000F75B7FB|nr:LysR substrate-binding domain-containing protein [Mesorhizobium sp. M9A.F.Ca.ET.002.03.1.2]AZO01465.1 LysR family transcriptional regulator [Mesorhizobium sp. M9A.F.Ca.ET.002.03.1.2]